MGPTERDHILEQFRTNPTETYSVDDLSVLLMADELAVKFACEGLARDGYLVERAPGEYTYNRGVDDDAGPPTGS